MANQYTTRGRAWEKANSWWVFLTYPPIGMTSFIAFLYVGFKVKNNKWKIYGLIYFAVTVLTFSLPTTEFLSVTAFIVWIVSIVHAYKIRPAYLVELDVLKSNESYLVRNKYSKIRQEAEQRFRGRPEQENSYEPVSLKEAVYNRPNKTEKQPKAAFVPPVKKSAVYDETVEKVDINKAAESELAAIPALGIILAKKVVIKRDEIGGFESFEQFAQIMGLKEHTKNQLRPRVYFSKSQNQQGKSGRMIDY